MTDVCHTQVRGQGTETLGMRGPNQGVSAGICWWLLEEVAVQRAQDKLVLGSQRAGGGLRKTCGQKYRVELAISVA